MLEFLTDYSGHLAGLSASILWVATSLLFTAAGHRIGPLAVNCIRIALAILFLGATHRVLAGHWIPEAQWGQIGFLAASGFIGLSIGDQALFTAFVDIGPRLATLIMTTAPLVAITLGWIFLGESLHWVGFLGVAMTVAGVAWVVLERPHKSSSSTSSPPSNPRPQPHRVRGIILALIGAACQAGGMLLSKQGIGHGWLPEDQHLTAQSATLIRMVFAAFGVVPIVLIHLALRRRPSKFTQRPTPTPRWSSGLTFTALGAIAGPFLGVWMSVVSADRVPVGVAQTLCSLTPLFILPFSRFLFHEKVSSRAVLGALVAVAGVALLFWPGA